MSNIENNLTKENLEMNKKQLRLELNSSNYFDNKVLSELNTFLDNDKLQVVRNILQFEIDKELRMRKFIIVIEGGELNCSISDNTIVDKAYRIESRIYNNEMEIIDYVDCDYLDSFSGKVINSDYNESLNFSFCNGCIELEFNTLEEMNLEFNKRINNK